MLTLVRVCRNSKQTFDKNLYLLLNPLKISKVLTRYHVLDHEYVGLLLKLIKKSNPYCVLYPKSLCRYTDLYLLVLICTD